jgi:ADP-ribose pyrophosphatase
MQMAFETAHSEVTYRGRVFKVLRDQVRLPNGNLAELDIVEHPGAVTLLPVDREGQMWLVRQYRHAAQAELLELPAGALDEDELPEDCARREVREEIGMAAGQLLKVGEFFLAPGYSTEYMYVYLATDLRPDPLQADDDEFLSVETIPIAQVYHLAETGQIRDSKSLAALFLARAHLDRLVSDRT